MCPNTTGIGYSATSTLTGSTFAWSIAGNGTVAPTSGNAVLVDTSGPGSFTLTVTVTKDGCASTCSLEVEVRATQPGFQLIAVNDKPCTRKTHGADEYLRFPNPTTGVGSLVNTFAPAFNSVEGLAVLAGTPPRLFGSNYDRLIEINPIRRRDRHWIDRSAALGDRLQAADQCSVRHYLRLESTPPHHIATDRGRSPRERARGEQLNDLAFHPDGRSSSSPMELRSCTRSTR